MPDTHAAAEICDTTAGGSPHVLRDEADARPAPALASAAGKREWSALLRKLDRESPGWRGQG